MYRETPLVAAISHHLCDVLRDVLLDTPLQLPELGPHALHLVPQSLLLQPLGDILVDLLLGEITFLERRRIIGDIIGGIIGVVILLLLYRLLVLKF